jgi:hypothetical protein
MTACKGAIFVECSVVVLWSLRFWAVTPCTDQYTTGALRQICTFTSILHLDARNRLKPFYDARNMTSVDRYSAYTATLISIFLEADCIYLAGSVRI